jgi:hypothetical protein
VAVVAVVDEVSVIVVLLVSVFVVDSCLHAKPNSATAAMVRKTRIVFFILFPSIELIFGVILLIDAWFDRECLPHLLAQP